MGNKRVKVRIIFIGSIVTLLLMAVLTRLFWIQSAQADWLVKEAESLWSRQKTIEPKRGTIYDRNGEVLAYSGTAYRVIAKLRPLSKNDHYYVKNPVEVASLLSPVLDVSRERLISQLTRENVMQVELPRGGWKVDEETADKIREMEIPGIVLSKTTRRYYPNGAFASHVLGYYDMDGRAVLGVEQQYNELLSGKEGSYQFLKDGAGYQLPDGLESIIPSEDGKDVYLTIDKHIQGYVEDALNEAEEKYHPQKMSVLVADPNTGEILALANRPHFNPYKYWDIENYQVQINHAVSSVFEPGSTFKIVTLAAAIEEGLFHPNETYQSGKYKIGPNTIRDHNNGKGWGEITFLEGVQKSSNVAFVILGYERLKKEKLFEYINRFGFGQPTKVGLPNEASGVMRNVNQAYPIEVATTTFGQGVGVTAIQQVAAVSAVANGGLLMKPYIVKAIADQHSGEFTQEFEPQEIRRVISESTSLKARNILETVVTEGTGSLYHMEGYRIAGKTGTAQKPKSDGRGYEEGNYIYSFIGFAPTDQPELLVYVVVDDPDVEYYAGAQMTSSIFKSIASKTFKYLKMGPEAAAETVIAREEVKIKVPELVGYSVETSSQKVLIEGGNPRVIGEGIKVIRQFPEPGTLMEKGGTVYLLTQKTDRVTVPDFKGMSLREALEYAMLLDIPIVFEGEGYVAEQSIQPGVPIKENDRLLLRLQPYPPDLKNVTTEPSD